MAARNISSLNVDTAIDITGATFTGADSALDSVSTRPVTNAALDARFNVLPNEWVSSQAYSKNDQVAVSGVIYSRISAGTSLSTFAADSSNWVTLSSAAVNELPDDWQTGTSYVAGDVVADSGRVYVVAGDYTSDATAALDIGAGDLIALSDLVVKPATTTDNSLARYDGTSGDIQPSTATLDDSGALSVTTLESGAVSLTGALTTTSTVDGRDVAADGTRLDSFAPNWSSGVSFVKGEQVWHSDRLYQCAVSHISTSSFDTVRFILVGSSNDAPRFHLTDTATAPATAGQPTAAEAEVVSTAEGITDRLLYYTGDDNASSSPTSVFWVDTAGAATMVRTSLDTSEPIASQLRVAKNGNDTTALASKVALGGFNTWDSTKPFQTITAAINAANDSGASSNGEQVYVEPGIYSETLTLKTNLTIHMSGVTVTGLDDGNSAVTSTITGRPMITNPGGTGVLIQNASSVSYFDLGFITASTPVSNAGGGSIQYLTT